MTCWEKTSPRKKGKKTKKEVNADRRVHHDEQNPFSEDNFSRLMNQLSQETQKSCREDPRVLMY